MRMIEIEIDIHTKAAEANAEQIKHEEKMGKKRDDFCVMNFYDVPALN